MGRAWFDSKTVLITSAGLFGAIISTQRGMDVHVLDHTDSVSDVIGEFKPDVIIAGSGVETVIQATVNDLQSYVTSSLRLTGVSNLGSTENVDLSVINCTA